MAARPGHHRVHPEPAGDLDRRPRVEEPVSVHAAERRHQRAQHGGARSWRRGCAQLPGLVDVTSDLLIENPQVTVDIDREQAGQLGVSASEIENTLYDAFGQRQVSTIYTSTNEYWVVMELLPEYQQDVDALGKLWVRSTRGPLVPLSTVASFRVQPSGPVTVNHSGQLPVGDGVVQPRAGRRRSARRSSEVQQTAAEVLPNTVAASFSGIARGVRDDAAGAAAAHAARGLRDLRHPRRACTRASSIRSRF